MINRIKLSLPALPVALVDFIVGSRSQYRHILEYGSGASTLLLSENFHEVISIESDLGFKRYLQKEIKKKNLSTVLLYANIGPTGRYGEPKKLFRKLFEFKYKNYSELPFSKIKSVNADLVLVDGRFRVACVVSCLLNLNKPFDLIVDDFLDRSEYHIILKFIQCESHTYFGRSILFRKVVPNRTLELRNILKVYKNITN